MSDTEKPQKRAKRRPRRPRGGSAGHSRTPSNVRHLARVTALQVLYEVDLTGHPVADVLERTLALEETAEGASESSELAGLEPNALAQLTERVGRLVQGVMEHQAEFDPLIAAAAPAFPVAQLAVVDRNVLRMALFELRFQPDVPPKVVINEAVEIAKRFGGDNSSRFVNGVLGTLHRQLLEQSGGVSTLEAG